MVEITSVENMRKSDFATMASGICGRTLMLKAANGIFKAVKQWIPPVAVVCGGGNNAGDGYALALILQSENIPCTVICTSDKFTADAKYYYDKCIDKEINILAYKDDFIFSGYGTIVDCLFGIGFKGDLKPPYISIINKINASDKFVVCVDINSGLDGDSGIANTCVVSDLTVSIGTYKCGHFLNMAKDVIKNKSNCDIGINLIDSPYYLLNKNDFKEIIRERNDYSHKADYGYIALIGGSMSYIGAPLLATMAAAAMRSGAGVVKLAVPKSIAFAVMPRILESTLYQLSEKNGQFKFRHREIENLIKNTKAVCVGMGLGSNADNKLIIKYLLKNYDKTLIIDADGINAIAEMDYSLLKNSLCQAVLTPHLKEFERLSKISISIINQNPVYYAKKFAKENNIILLLKGPSSIITDGNIVYITDTGCAGMATAGSGDCLSGIVTALAGSSENLLLSVACGAYINGLAGELAQKETNCISMTAGDTVKNIPKAINQILE